MKYDEQRVNVLRDKVMYGDYVAVKPEPPIPPIASVNHQSPYSHIKMMWENLSKYMEASERFEQDMEQYGRKQAAHYQALITDIANTFNKEPKLIKRLLKLTGDLNTVTEQRAAIAKLKSFFTEEDLGEL